MISYYIIASTLQIIFYKYDSRIRKKYLISISTLLIIILHFYNMFSSLRGKRV